jgi:hypothetical protein
MLVLSIILLVAAIAFAGAWWYLFETLDRTLVPPSTPPTKKAELPSVTTKTLDLPLITTPTVVVPVQHIKVEDKVVVKQVSTKKAQGKKRGRPPRVPKK